MNINHKNDKNKMKRFLYFGISVLLMLIPCAVCADNDAHQIPLVEIPSSDDDSGRDDPGSGYVPTDPSQFSAIINGHVLSVGVSGSGPWTPHLRVYKADGTLVTNRRFHRTISVNLADTGYYTLTLTLGTLTFQGEFEITD